LISELSNVKSGCTSKLPLTAKLKSPKELGLPVEVQRVSTVQFLKCFIDRRPVPKKVSFMLSNQFFLAKPETFSVRWVSLYKEQKKKKNSNYFNFHFGIAV